MLDKSNTCASRIPGNSCQIEILFVKFGNVAFLVINGKGKFSETKHWQSKFLLLPFDWLTEDIVYDELVNKGLIVQSKIKKKKFTCASAETSKQKKIVLFLEKALPARKIEASNETNKIEIV
ncbi:hypothetical protein T10_13315 [Trichinella papuae]|uniref:Uncharacterized protein n=1 Tax=Trichinella papuae TaxID=268474 RepID=A0A0V1MH52_9BILA|nr:hypothetical protein T10_13315 [Trichinella papuae]